MFYKETINTHSSNASQRICQAARRQSVTAQDRRESTAAVFGEWLCIELVWKLMLARPPQVACALTNGGAASILQGKTRNLLDVSSSGTL